MMQIRAATPDDAAAIAAIYAPYVATNMVSFEEKAPSSRVMRSRMEESGGLLPWIVCEDQASGVVLGYGYAKPFRPGEAYRFAVEIAVYTAGGYEGQGIRKSMLTALIATLIEQNFTQAIVTLVTPNDKLIQLYEAVGFRRAGQYREVCYKNGQWNDIGMWQRELSEPGKPPAELKPFAETGVVRG
ncbi:MAG TPA: N-acetyltransferase family protein [Chakrabartia sp.]|nr:N-acetyltransferase family protein [Chakrabartia sp.]